MNDREPFIYIKQMYMKGFFDLEENCKEKIISEDYWDFISKRPIRGCIEISGCCM